MDNTDKLLRAFIEASGYEVEEIRDIKLYYHPDNIQSNGEPKENAPHERIVNTKYKVTKRDEDFISMSKDRYAELLAGYEAWQNHE